MSIHSLDDGTYVAVVHPSMAEALKLTPRQAWKMLHRTERLRKRGIVEPDIVGSLGTMFLFGVTQPEEPTAEMRPADISQ